MAYHNNIHPVVALRDGAFEKSQVDHERMKHGLMVYHWIFHRQQLGLFSRSFLFHGTPCGECFAVGLHGRD